MFGVIIANLLIGLLYLHSLIWVAKNEKRRRY